VLALAALSARALAGWAAADGMPAIALDVFGDADTRATARAWHAIGDPAPPRIDGRRLLAVLGRLAARGDAQAWVAGSGFEAEPALLAQAAGVLPLLGTAPSDQARLADPVLFFAALDAFGIAHPPVAFEPPASGGWLRKRARSAGGWGIDRRRDVAPGVYWQRERAGRAMSATFVANADRAVVLGFNRLATLETGERPFVFAGACGPVPVTAGVRRDVERALAALVPAFGLRGLGSVDFIVGDDDGGAELLEVNARPSASAALYPELGGRSPLHAHLRACQDGELPAVPQPHRARALRIVFARRPLRLDATGTARVAAAPGATDLPTPGTPIAAGEPLCTLHADAPDADAAAATLQHAEQELLGFLETPR
jgi:uncharacterized protein